MTTRSFLLAVALAACGGLAAADPASTFTPKDVFDGCDASQSMIAQCQLFAGKKPSGYTAAPKDNCSAKPSHRATTCPAAHLLGACEAAADGTTMYVYYYDTNRGNAAAAASCKAAGQTWHPAS